VYQSGGGEIGPVYQASLEYRRDMVLDLFSKDFSVLLKLYYIQGLRLLVKRL
jgi:hypothetical protein